jgi:hypothetical protein
VVEALGEPNIPVTCTSALDDPLWADDESWGPFEVPQPTTHPRIDPIRIQGIAKVLELLIVQSFESSNLINEKH